MTRSLGHRYARALVAMAALAAGEARAGDCTERWEVFSSKPYEQIALPDTNVTYRRIRFKLAAGQPPVFLRIKGRFPYARYANFNLYDQATQNSSASIADLSIEPDAGSVNPYRPAVDRAAANRDYTLVVASETGAPANTSTERLLELWYRVYLPDDPAQDLGGVPLPRVEAFADAAATTPVPCPEPAALDPSILTAVDALPPENPLDAIYTFRPRATGLYANLDAAYLGTRLRLLGGNVVVLRFKPPAFPNTRAGLARFYGGEDVRYWSLCLGGLDQRTSACLHDAELKPNDQGWVTLVVGPEDVRETAASRGQAFLPWGRQLFQVLVYRNLLARDTFAGYFGKVRQVEAGALFDPETYAAHRFIGDHAPRGQRCSRQKYKAGNCGMP